MGDDHIELLTPYESLRAITQRLLEARPSPWILERIGEDLTKIQVFLTVFATIDLGVTSNDFDRLAYDITQTFCRYSPIWPSPFTYFIYCQLDGRGRSYEEIIDYLQALVDTNRTAETDWIIARFNQSNSLIVYNRAVPQIEEKMQEMGIAPPDPSVHLPDDILDSFPKIFGDN